MPQLLWYLIEITGVIEHVLKKFTVIQLQTLHCADREEEEDDKGWKK